jgi:dipeptidyl aminopeptidase/acylaminoacyl peptidase
MSNFTQLTLGVFLLCNTAALAQNIAPLSVEKIMRDPKSWIGTAPTNPVWSSDSKTIYFNWNPDVNPGDSLYSYNLTSQKTTAVNSATRQKLPSATGIFNKLQTLKLYAKNGDIFIQDLRSGAVKTITQTIQTESNPVWSLDEKSIIFESNKNLFSISLETGLLTQHTHFLPGTSKATAKLSEQEQFLKTDQLALFDILQERKTKRESTLKALKSEKAKTPKEIYLGDKSLTSIKLSPDAKYVTYQLAQNDKTSKSTAVPNYVTESGFTEHIPARTKVGAPASSYEFWVYDIAQDTTFKISMKDIAGFQDKPDFLKDYPKIDSSWSKKPRGVIFHGPFWSENGKHNVVVARSVDNKDRWIMELDLPTHQLKLLDRQRDEAWIGGPGIGNYAMSAGEIGWINEHTVYFQSEATGYAHLYAYDLNTGIKKALTSGSFEVQSVQLSKDKKSFYLSTNEVHPGEQHFYKMSVTGGKREQITQKTGAHEVYLSPDESKLAIRYSNSNTPWELYVMDNKVGGKSIKVTHSTKPAFESYPWKEAKVVTIKATDGENIYSRVYEPTKSNGKAVIFVHGAGYLQNAHKWWSQYFREYMFHHLLTDLGYTVLDIDYRASAGYGRNWRTGIYRFMGGKDLSDHVDAAKWLVDQYKIDQSKIGIYGGSYGGFITLMALFTTPDVFKAGAALRPVTDWAAYNHPYTANILNEPQTDSLAYRKSSPIYHAQGLKNNLLICHGVLDVNVHYQDVVRLSQRLIELGKDNWELASYPMEDHGFVEPSSWTDEYKRILKLFEEKL